MDFLKKVATQASQNLNTNTTNNNNTTSDNNNGSAQEGHQSANADSGVMGKLNGVLGGGAQGEKKEGTSSLPLAAYYTAFIF